VADSSDAWGEAPLPKAASSPSLGQLPKSATVNPRSESIKRAVASAHRTANQARGEQRCQAPRSPCTANKTAAGRTRFLGTPAPDWIARKQGPAKRAVTHCGAWKARPRTAAGEGKAGLGWASFPFPCPAFGRPRGRKWKVAIGGQGVINLGS